jgi:predicted metal-dependent HD superfamily phosphohydrolase
VTLLDAWLTLVPGAEEAGRDLLARWDEPQRHYHTTEHLRFMLSILDNARAGPAVRLAAWFHDAVYDPMGANNERASADLAAEVLPPLGIAPDTVAEVVRLVRLTEDHAVAPDDADGGLLADADLAILGTPPDRYAEYAAAVRAEYAHVPDEAFRVGRSAVLEALLAIDPLYHLAPHRIVWEAPARANMRAELARL